MMPDQAVFLDRDKTLMEDPGYVSDPQAVKLLPGVELAIKSLHQSGYKIVVVTNQSGVARGLLTEEALEQIHGELRRQLGEKGVHLDGIYYCPYHPEGTVEQYAKDSELRKPKPGMLLKAAADLDIDLAGSWMVGDSARDMEAGQRAGCRTIRVRLRPPPGHSPPTGEDQDESVQADHTVRNLVDAARIILREGRRRVERGKGEQSSASARPGDVEQAASPQQPPVELMDDTKIRQEILRHVRRMAVERNTEEFSLLRLLAGVVQMLALLGLVLTFLRMLENNIPAATLWALIALVLQVMALTFFMVQRPR